MNGARGANEPFTTVNCTTLSDPLLESELFGHVKGAFTGAYRDKPGRLEAADGGTVFLDEAAELPLNLQAKFLRYLQEGCFERGRRANQAGRYPNNRWHQPQTGRRSLARLLPRGFVLPPQHDKPSRSSAPRTPRRHSIARPEIADGIRDTQRPRAIAFWPRRGGRADSALVARKSSRVT
jgi:sigma-54 interacting transcriptional regulator